MPRPSIVPHELLREIPGVDATLLATVAAGLGAALMTIAQMVLLSRIIQGVLLARQHVESVIPLLIATTLAMLARAAFIVMREVISRRGAGHVQMMVRERLLRHLLQLGPAYLNRERTGELVVAATEGIDRLGPYVSRYLPQRLLSIGVPLLIVAVVLPYDWVSALLLVASAPIILLLLVLIGGYTEERTQRQWETLGRLSALFLDAIQGLPTLMVFDGGEKQGRKRVVESSEKFRVQTLGVLRIATISGATLELMSAVAIGLVAATLGVRLLDRGIAFDHAFLVFLLTPEFYRPLRELGVQRHAAMEGAPAARRIMEILSVPTPPASRFQAPAGGVHAVDDTPPTPPASRHSAEAIELVNLGYSYPASARPALDGVELTLQPGSCTALVGSSGAGKTTLVNLLLRFIEPTSGAILLGGVPSTLFGVDQWRARVALVPQQPYLLAGSVRDNIRLANPRATDREVRLAAEMAGIHRFLADLPHGYDTPLGERGYGLSAGQRQRLALARAFLKNAPILILDEPTSALDPESELLVRAGIEQVRSSGPPVSDSGLPVLDCRIVLIVAHRLNTVLSADQVAVLEDGRVVEAGSHLDLLDRGGAYARLLRADTRTEALA